MRYLPGIYRKLRENGTSPEVARKHCLTSQYAGNCYVSSMNLPLRVEKVMRIKLADKLENRIWQATPHPLGDLSNSELRKTALAYLLVKEVS